MPENEMISVIVPVFCEEDNVLPLYEKLRVVLDSLSYRSEIIFVDDGSPDGTMKAIEPLVARDTSVRLIRFRRNFGQTAAIMAGIDLATGSILIPMDGDLQNDPADIPKLLAKLDEGYDVVSGWRRERRDEFFSRVLPSRVANMIISRVSGVKLRDLGCTLKAYRSEVLRDVRLYGEMHRFIPIFAEWQGGKVTETPVAHHPRRHGKSKYGLGRVIKVILDIFVVKFFTGYHNKPIYVFGSFGALMFLASFFFLGLMVYYKYVGNIMFHESPLPLLCAISFATGIICILLGLVAELLVRIYYETQDKRTYVIAETLNIEQS